MAAAGVVLLMVLSSCAIFCAVAAESTEQAFNVSQEDGETLSRVDENVDGVGDQYMRNTEDEAGSTEESNGESADDDDDEGAVSVGIHHRSGSQRRLLVQKKKPAPHGVRCSRAAQCKSHHFRKPGCCTTCVDLYSNALHCGKCGKKCKAGFQCVGGKCKKLSVPKKCGVHAACKKGSTCCKNKACVNLYSDATNCGKCGKKCKAGFQCVGGKCKKLPKPKRCGVHAECKKGSTCCKNKSCVNLYSDATNCGKCGKKCKVGFQCVGGKCKKLPKPKRCGVHAECKKGATCCKNKSCVNLYSDATNCGKCGKRCKAGFQCVGGKCKKLPKRCGVHAACKKGFTCCENNCVKLNGGDKFNCGKCGRKCGFGSVCCTGECKYIYRNDADHCGGCHKRCKHGVKCTYGICGYN